VIQCAQNQHWARTVVYAITALLNIVFSLVFISCWGYWAQLTVLLCVTVFFSLIVSLCL
jgi:hypothetical protein